MNKEYKLCIQILDENGNIVKENSFFTTKLEHAEDRYRLLDNLLEKTLIGVTKGIKSENIK